MSKNRNKHSMNKYRLIKHYAEFITNVFPDIDINSDIIKEIKERLKRLENEKIMYRVYDGKIHRIITITPKVIIDFINNANNEEVDTLVRIITKKIKRMMEIDEEANKIGEMLRDYVKVRGIPIPIVIRDLDKIRISGRKYDYAIKIQIGTHTYMDELVGRDLKEIVEQIKPTVDKELKIARKLMINARREREKAISQVSGLREFLNEVESHVYDAAIITIAGKNLANPWSYPKEIAALLGFGLIMSRGIEIIKWDMQRAGTGEILYGSSPTLWPRFYGWFTESLRNNESLSIILRSFLNIRDERTGLPIKEIRGYITTYKNNALTYQQLTAKEIMEAETTDPETGEKTHEPAVIYCGPGNDKIYSP